MSLLTQAMEDVVMLEKKRVPDGEGGFTTDWAEGVQFKAAISFDSSMQARTAEKQGVTDYEDLIDELKVDIAVKDGDVIACGDMDNDIAMLQAAGTGICLANGSEATKKAADFVTEKDVCHDGLGEYLLHKYF